jgi:hypothetical protein
MDHPFETEQIEEKAMKNQNRSRHFAIRAAQAKKAKLAETTIEIGGNVVQITAANARFADAVRTRRVEEAYEQAAYAQLRLAA